MDKYQVLYNHREDTWTVIEKLANYFVVLVSHIDNEGDAKKVAKALNAQEAPSA